MNKINRVIASSIEDVTLILPEDTVFYDVESSPYENRYEICYSSRNTMELSAEELCEFIFTVKSDGDVVDDDDIYLGSYREMGLLKKFLFFKVQRI